MTAIAPITGTLSTSAVARELGISRRTISRKIRQDVNDTAVTS